MNSKRSVTTESAVLDGTTTSLTVYLDLTKVFAIQVAANFTTGQDATATLAGTVAFTTSNHPKAFQATNHKGIPVVWSTESDVTIANITSGAYNEMVHVGNCGARWGRIVVSRTSGTGEVALLIHGVN